MGKAPFRNLFSARIPPKELVQKVSPRKKQLAPETKRPKRKGSFSNPYFSSGDLLVLPKTNASLVGNDIPHQFGHHSPCIKRKPTWLARKSRFFNWRYIFIQGLFFIVILVFGGVPKLAICEGKDTFSNQSFVGISWYVKFLGCIPPMAIAVATQKSLAKLRGGSFRS